MKESRNESSKYAGTGHRPEILGGHTSEIVHRYARYILNAHQPNEVITGMALGWDTALGLACIDLGIPFISAVPFLGQESVWTKADQARYFQILGKAKEVKIVSAGGYAFHKYHTRDRWMIDNSTHVLALWNGQKMGGTYATVKYALKIKREVFNVWPGWIDYE